MERTRAGWGYDVCLLLHGCERDQSRFVVVSGSDVFRVTCLLLLIYTYIGGRGLVASARYGRAMEVEVAHSRMVIVSDSTR